MQDEGLQGATFMTLEQKRQFLKKVLSFGALCCVYPEVKKEWIDKIDSSSEDWINRKFDVYYQKYEDSSHGA